MVGKTRHGFAAFFFFFAVAEVDLVRVEARLLATSRFVDGELPELNRAGP